MLTMVGLSILVWTCLAVYMADGSFADFGQLLLIGIAGAPSIAVILWFIVYLIDSTVNLVA